MPKIPPIYYDVALADPRYGWAPGIWDAPLTIPALATKINVTYRQAHRVVGTALRLGRLYRVGYHAGLMTFHPDASRRLPDQHHSLPEPTPAMTPPSPTTSAPARRGRPPLVPTRADGSENPDWAMYLSDLDLEFASPKSVRDYATETHRAYATARKRVLAAVERGVLHPAGARRRAGPGQPERLYCFDRAAAMRSLLQQWFAAAAPPQRVLGVPQPELDVL